MGIIAHRSHVRDMPDCPEWCDGIHTDAENTPGAWAHFSPPETVAVSVEDPGLARMNLEAHIDVWTEAVWTSDRRRPVVQIHTGDDYLPPMTPAEARKLTAAILNIADLAEGK